VGFQRGVEGTIRVDNGVKLGDRMGGDKEAGKGDEGEII